MQKWKPYAKAVVAFVVGAATFGAGLLTDNDWNSQDTITMIGWAAATLGVYQVPNRPPVTPTTG